MMAKQTLGPVYLARNKESGEQVLVKLIERGPSVSRHLESELLLHRHARGGGGGWGEGGAPQGGACERRHAEA